MKKYKPGQFVSIGGKLARVSIATVEITLDYDVCKICKRESGNTSYCYNASECSKKLGFYSYPKFIEQ